MIQHLFFKKKKTIGHICGKWISVFRGSDKLEFFLLSQHAPIALALYVKIMGAVFHSCCTQCCLSCMIERWKGSIA